MRPQGSDLFLIDVGIGVGIGVEIDVGIDVATT